MHTVFQSQLLVSSLAQIQDVEQRHLLQPPNVQKNSNRDASRLNFLVRFNHLTCVRPLGSALARAPHSRTARPRTSRVFVFASSRQDCFFAPPHAAQLPRPKSPA